MNIMKIPSYTAEASLNKTCGRYRMTAAGDLARGSGILPQLPIGFCQANCDHIQDDFLRSVCYLRCFDQPGNGGSGGGGGGGQHCRPGCGPCHADEDSPTGRYKTCIKANCEEYDRIC